MVTCRHKKPDGSKCKANALPGKRLCVFHDPSSEKARAEGRRQGGVTRSRPAATLPPDMPDTPLETVADVITCLSQTINQVRTGRLDCRVGNCLGVLAGVLLKALESGDLEARIDALEARQRRVA
jgi:hypothetical protein